MTANMYHQCEITSLAADAITDVMLVVKVLEHHAERIGSDENLPLHTAAKALRKVCNAELRRAAKGEGFQAELVISKLNRFQYGVRTND